MLDCWNADPMERPTFTQLRAKFDAMLAEDNPYIQFDTIDSHKPYYNSPSPEDERTIGISDIDEDISVNSEESSSTAQGASRSECEFPKPNIPQVHIDQTLGNPVPNPYVNTPTKLPCDPAFDLAMIHCATHQTIQEDPETSEQSTEHLIAQEPQETEIWFI